MTDSPITLEFPLNDSDEDEGLGHAGIATYRSQPYAGAARETGQNSRDAGSGSPVRMTFDLLEVPLDEIPALDRLRSVVDRSLDDAITEDKEKEKAFFEQAKATLSAGPLKVLRVADFNTTGARGPATKGTAFYSLLRASGVSVKERPDAGGSYGIGKNAAFAISDLRTVFYATAYEDPATHETSFLAQGKSILVSHRDENGDPRRQLGYWGQPGYRPISDPLLVPEWMRRSDRGTSLFVMGFRDVADWQYRIACALIENFFPAIFAGDMEFSIDDGKIHIGRETLLPLFQDEAMRAAAKANENELEFDIAFQHYQCLASPDAKDHLVQVAGLGEVKIRVLVAENLPKKICITRNGMVITDNLKNFSEPFLRFPMYREFAAVVTPLDAAGSSFIKKLEDPKHVELSPEGLPDEASRANAKAVMKRFGKAIRDAVKADSLIAFGAEVAADEMRDYFASEAKPEDTQRTSPNDDPETIKYVVEPRRPKRRSNAVVDDEEDGEDIIVTPGPAPGPHPGPGPIPGPGPGPGTGPTPGPDGPSGPRPGRPIALTDVRNRFASPGDATRRSIFFTPDAGGRLDFGVEAVGVNNNETIRISSTSVGLVSNGLVSLSVNGGERYQVDVVLDEPYNGPIEIRARLAPEVRP